MSLDTVIIIGPTTDFNPIASNENPKFELPFLNVPLLAHTINAIRPFSERLFVLCLESYEEKVLKILRNCDMITEVVLMNGYEGFYACMCKIVQRLESKIFFMCKGDVFFSDALDSVISSFEKGIDEMCVFVRKSDNKSPVMSIDESGYLRSYESEIFPFIKNAKLTITTEYSIQGFYLCKKSILDDIDPSCYSFKSNFIPKAIENYRSIRVLETNNIQIKTVNDYMKQVEYKMTSVFGCLVFYPFMMIERNMKDNVYEEGCRIGDQTRISRSVLLKNVTIGAGCVIDGCIIGEGVFVCDGCKLINCRVAPGFTFNEPITAKSTTFNN